jgi:hypothetical protein
MQEHISVLKDLPALTAPALHGFIAVWGLLDCFFGLKIFKATVRILMAFVGATFAATLAMHFMPQSITALLVSSAVGLLVGIVVGWYVWKMGAVVMAVFAAFVLTSPIAAQLAPTYAVILPAVAGLLAGILVFVMLEPVIIGSTAMTGAFRLVYGVAFFMGGPNLLDYISGGKGVQDLFLGGDWRLAGLTLLLAAAGCYVQLLFWRARKPKKAEE